MRRKILIAIAILIPVLILNFVGIFGYCRSWWGVDSFIMRSLWLCSCPSAFEQALYPKHVEVAFSACANVTMQPVIDGTYYEIIGYDLFGGSNSYLWQPVTNEKIPITVPQTPYEILSPEFAHLRAHYAGNEKVPSYLLRWSNGKSVPIDLLDVDGLPSPYLSDGSINPDIVNLLFADSTQIFTEFTRSNYIIVLGPDWLARPERNYILYGGMLPNENENWLQDIVAGTKHIPVTEVLSKHESMPKRQSLISPNGLYEAHADGINNVETGERIVDFSSSEILPCPLENCSIGFGDLQFYPTIWLFDSSTVFYQADRFPSAVTALGSVPLPSILVGSPIKYVGIVPPVLKINVTNIEKLEKLSNP